MTLRNRQAVAPNMMSGQWRAIYRINNGDVVRSALDGSLPRFCRSFYDNYSAFDGDGLSFDYKPSEGGFEPVDRSLLPSWAAHVPNEVLNTESFNSHNYQFPLVDGVEYIVQLYFNELFHTSAGMRLFNVLINDYPVLNNLDVWLEAGGARGRPIAYRFKTKPVDGIIKIGFQTVIDNAKINCIEILEPYNIKADYIEPVTYGQLYTFNRDVKRVTTTVDNGGAGGGNTGDFVELRYWYQDALNFHFVRKERTATTWNYSHGYVEDGVRSVQQSENDGTAVNFRLRVEVSDNTHAAFRRSRPGGWNNIGTGYTSSLFAASARRVVVSNFAMNMHMVLNDHNFT